MDTRSVPILGWEGAAIDLDDLAIPTSILL